jgi:hypothetical protein
MSDRKGGACHHPDLPCGTKVWYYFGGEWQGYRIKTDFDPKCQCSIDERERFDNLAKDLNIY